MTQNYQRAIANLVPGNTYLLRVRSINELGQQSDWSESIVYTVPTSTTSPAGVTGFQVSSEYQTFIIQWAPNTERDFDHYELYYGTSANFTPDTTGYSNLIYDGSAAVFVYPVGNTNDYWFALRSVNTAGSTSAFSTYGPYTVSGTLINGTLVGGTSIVGNTLVGGTIIGAEFDINSSANSGIFFEGAGNITWKSGATGGIIVPNAEGFIESSDFSTTNITGWRLDGSSGLTMNSNPYVLNINAYNTKPLWFYEELGGGNNLDIFYVNDSGLAYFYQGVITGGGSNSVVNSSFESVTGQSLSGGTAVADYWGEYSSGTNGGLTFSISTTTGVVDGYNAQEVTWTSNTGNIGIYANITLPAGGGTQNQWAANTTWVISWWATENCGSNQSQMALAADTGTGFTDTWLVRPGYDGAPNCSATVPQRYVVKRVIGSAAISTHLYIVSTAASGTITYDCVQVEQSLTASPWQTKQGEVLALQVGANASQAFYVDGKGNLWTGASTFSSAPFSVSNTGVLTASNASISGNISGSSISGGSISGSSISGGSININNTFTVDSGGNLTANSASLTGSINNSGTVSSYNGSYPSSLNITSGQITFDGNGVPGGQIYGSYSNGVGTLTLYGGQTPYAGGANFAQIDLSNASYGTVNITTRNNSGPINLNGSVTVASDLTVYSAVHFSYGGSVGSVFTPDGVNVAVKAPGSTGAATLQDGSGRNLFEVYWGSSTVAMFPNGLPSVSGSYMGYASNGQIGYVASSRSVKLDIRDIVNGQESNPLFKMRPRTFKYNPALVVGARGVDEAGLIVEELIEVAPDTVYLGSDENPISINLYAMMGYVIDAIQFLGNRLEFVAGRIDK